MMTESGASLRMSSGEGACPRCTVTPSLLTSRRSSAEDVLDGFPMRRQIGDAELSAKLCSLLEQMHVVTTTGCNNRGRQAGRARANDRDPARRRHFLQQRLQTEFLARHRVDRAGDASVTLYVRHAFVAGDAGGNLVLQSCFRLRGKIGVRDQRPAEADDIRVTRSPECLRRVRDHEFGRRS